MELEQLSKKLETIDIEVADILPDFKLLSERIPLVDSSYKYFSLIFTEIKETILKDMHKLTEPLHSDIKKINENLDRHKELTRVKLKEIENATEGLKLKLDNLTIEHNAHSSTLERINSMLDNMNEDILDRAKYSEFKSLSSLVDTKVNVATMEDSISELKLDLTHCVKIPDFDSLQVEVKKIKDNSKKLSTMDQLKSTASDLKHWVGKELQNFVVQEDFKVYKEDISFKFTDTQEKIDRNESIQGFANDAVRKELVRLDKDVKKRPWKKDIEIFRMNLQEAAKIVELQKHKEKISEDIVDFKGIIDRFGLRCDKYEKVLERFDEILLEKAAKDDMFLLKKSLGLYAKAEDVDSFKKGITKSFGDVEVQFESVMEKFKSFEGIVGQVSAAFRSFKSDNKDSIQMKNAIIDLKNSVENKAEKVDILAISESIIKKDEHFALKNGLDVTKRQLEMQIAISHALIRTMVKTTESASLKNKQRVYLLKNATSLMNWAVNASTTEMSTNSLVSSGMHQKSYQEIESSFLLPTIRHNRKFSNSDTLPNIPMDILKLKGKYDI